MIEPSPPICFVDIQNIDRGEEGIERLANVKRKE